MSLLLRFGRGSSWLPGRTAAAALQQLHTTPAAANRGKRKHKKLRKNRPDVDARYRHGPFLKVDHVVATSPIMSTKHPANQFAEEEERLARAVADASKDDLPLGFGSNVAESCSASADPYAKEAISCVLCPRRYSVPIRADYKNPKLLAQFVSPHTGLVYKAHITGLCAFMQEEVEMATKKAQHFGEEVYDVRCPAAGLHFNYFVSGYLATRMKELHYYKDPALFNPSRPFKRNPH